MSRIFSVWCAVCCIMSALYGQTSYSIREKIEINQWEFTPDGLMKDVFSLIGDIQDWKSVQLPHSWVNRTEQRNIQYENALYRSKFILSKQDLGKRIYLLFERGGLVTDVYVNERKIGQHKGGCTHFVFDVTDEVYYDQDNIIVVKISNKPQENTLPLRVRWGLGDKVYLLKTHPCHIDPTHYASSGVYIAQTDVSDTRAILTLTTKLQNKTAQRKQFNVQHRIIDAEGLPVNIVCQSTTVEPRSQISLIIKGAVNNPILWSIVNPYLYVVETTLFVDGRIVDNVRERIGFRYFNLTHNKFVLNGKSLLLRGANYCWPDREDWGSAMPREALYEDMQNIKDMGMNTVRLAHWPFPKSVYEAADELGLVLMVENGNSWGNPVRDETAHDLCREFMYQAFNHPSIFFWSTGNENTSQSYIDFGETMQKVDQTRVIVAVNDKNPPIYTNNNCVFNNKYYGWYEGICWDFEDRVKKYHLIGETGAGSLRNHHQQYRTTMFQPGTYEPEEYAQLILEAIHQVSFVNAPDNVPVLYVWLYRDIFSSKMKNYNSKGYLAAGEFKKDTYYHFRSFARPDQELLWIVGKHWVLRGDENDIKVYGNSEKVTLWVNGQQKGSRINGSYTHTIYDDRVVQNVFYWEDVLSIGRNEIRIEDNRGLSDQCIIYYTAGESMLPDEKDAAVINLLPHNYDNPVYYVESAPQDQWPVYYSSGSNCDNTFTTLPDFLKKPSIGRILTNRQSDSKLTRSLIFTINPKCNQADIYLLISGELIPKWAKDAGFSLTDHFGQWRNNWNILNPYKIYWKKAEGGDTIQIEPQTIDFCVFVNPTFAD